MRLPFGFRGWILRRIYGSALFGEFIFIFFVCRYCTIQKFSVNLWHNSFKKINHVQHHFFKRGGNSATTPDLQNARHQRANQFQIKSTVQNEPPDLGNYLLDRIARVWRASLERLIRNRSTIFRMKRRPLTRKDLGKKAPPPSGLHLAAFLAGTDNKVFVCDIHFGDDDLCYLENAEGVPTKIEDLEIEVLEPHERGQGRKKSENPKVNITYRIDPNLAEWLKTRSKPTEEIENALKKHKKIVTESAKGD